MIAARCKNSFGIWTEPCRTDLAGVPQDYGIHRAGHEIPDFQHSVITARREVNTIGRERRMIDPAPVLQRRDKLLTGIAVPYTSLATFAARH